MSKDTLLECSHCKQPILEPVPGEAVGKQYCCYGCKVVDELMDSDQSIIDHKQLKLEPYLYLNEPKIREKLCRFEDDSYSRISIHLPAIHCSSCIYLLENLAEVEEGILQVQVHFSKKEADIQFNNTKISLAQIAAILDYIGYRPDFKTHLDKNRKPRNTLLLQLGVAGFFFGNTMLLALPEYLDESLVYDPELQRFFRFLMMGFSIPVVLFSARDYFSTAFKSLRAGALSIDLPIALGISVLFIRSAYEVLVNVGSGYFDSLTALVFFLLVGKWYQAKTYRNFSFDRDLRSFLPLAATKIEKDESHKPVSIDDLKEGDQILLKAGEVLAADSFLESETAELNYSYLSGESLPLTKLKGEKIYAGARLIGHSVRLKVSASVDHSYLSTLWAQDAFISGKKQGRSFSDSVSQYFTPIIILLALGGAIYWWSEGPSKALLVFTSVLIVACPCALALAEPFASGSMMRWFGRFGFFLKSSKVLTQLVKIDHLVFDKTGTLTKNDDIKVAWHGDTLSFEDRWAIATIALNAQHPLAKVLLGHLDIAKADANAALEFEEASGEGVGARVRASYFRLGKASFLNLTDTASTTSVYIEKDAKVLGYFSFYQETRENLEEIAASLSHDYELSVLSGDNDAEARRFDALFKSKAKIVFNCSPHQKLDYLKELQSKGQEVLMLGDGLNDAGALQQSEVGISLCEKDISFFPASDALLMADSFPKLSRFIALAKRSQKVVYTAFALSFFYNIIGVIIALMGYLSPVMAAVLMPISSVTVVLFTTLRSAYLARQSLSKD